MAKGTKKIVAKRIGANTKKVGAKTKKVGAKRIGAKRIGAKKVGGKWSMKYKKSINCNRPKGFSQKQHCKYGRNTRKMRGGGRVHHPWESLTDVIKREKRAIMTENQIFAEDLIEGKEYMLLDDETNINKNDKEILNISSNLQTTPTIEKIKNKKLYLNSKSKDGNKYYLSFSDKTTIIYITVKPYYVFEIPPKEESHTEEEPAVQAVAEEGTAKPRQTRAEMLEAMRLKRGNKRNDEEEELNSALGLLDDTLAQHSTPKSL